MKEGEVIVKVAAAGVNYVDLLYSRGKHQNNRSLVRPPFTLGLEFAGTVVSVGPPSSSNIANFHPGDRVFGGSLGSYADYVSVPESSLHLIPAPWTFTHAAGLGATLPVSYGALILRGGLQKGETVLIHAAAGGLGLMAVQIAKAVGAKVIATGSSGEKLEVARRFGADICVDYGIKKWWEIVLDGSGRDGVDVVFDPVGLVGDSMRCLKPMGRVLVVGFAGREGNLEDLAVNRILLKQAKVIGYRFGMTDRMYPEETKKIWEGLKVLWESGQLKPTIFDKEYRGLESVIQAMKDMRERKVWGKAVVLVNPEEEKARL